MNLYFTAKHWAKQIRWQYRRWRTAAKWGNNALANAPIVFGNAMPKSGSHLLTQILEGLTNLGPLVDPGFPPVNRSEQNLPLTENQIQRNVERMKSGDIHYGYLHAVEPYLSIFSQPNRATLFISRDPRDMLVSHVYYATEMYEEHGMHDYYNKNLDSMEARLDAAIVGVTEPGFELSSVRERYDSYLGWLDHHQVLCVKFEDLILDREMTLGNILDYLNRFGFSPANREEAINVLKDSIAPRKSGTFRKGQPGNWREHFTDANKARFKEVAGDLLIQLGYEANHDW